MYKFQALVPLFFFTLTVYAQEESFSKVLSTYITYPSTEHNEKPAGLYLLDQCKKAGLNTKILTDKDSAFNFVASLYPLEHNKPNIILLNHIDVVGIADTVIWKHPPFSGKIEKDTIWGRGALDNKGMAVAQLYALTALKENLGETNLPYNVSLLSVSGEETGSELGAPLVVDHFLTLLNPYLMLGEGGSGVTNILASNPDKAVFGISTVEKTRLILNLELELESSGHGSIPPPEYATKEMIMALEKLLSDKQEIIFYDITVQSLKKLGENEKGLRRLFLKHNQFFLFRPIIKRQIKKDPLLSSMFRNTMTLTGITLPSTSVNQLSSKISASFDCRLLPCTPQKEFIENIQEKLKENRIVIKPLTVEKSGGRVSNQKHLDVLSKSLSTVFPGSVTIEILFPATSDNHLFRKKGIPVYGLFPAIFSETQLSTIHSSNEYITIEQMEKAIKAYYRILENIQLTLDPSAISADAE